MQPKLLHRHFGTRWMESKRSARFARRESLTTEQLGAQGSC
jgi:hypothetical protein